MQNQRNRNRTHYIHRLTYTAQERLAGSFVLVAVFVLTWLLVTADRTQNLFEEEFTLYGAMNSIQAVNEGSDVIVSGLVVGSVSGVDITEDNKAVINMAILKKYQKLIRADSTADLINFKLAMVGKSAIEISIGSPSLPVLKEGSTIQINESLNLVKIIEKVEPVLASLEDSIKQTNRILHAIDPDKVRLSLDSLQHSLEKTATILNTIEPQKIAGSLDNVYGVSSDARAISHQLQSGRGVAGGLLYNEKLNRDIQTSTHNLTQLTEQMKQLLSSLQEQVYGIPELTGKIKPLLDEADKTIKATQQIWPLSGAIRKDHRQRLTPAGSME